MYLVAQRVQSPRQEVGVNVFQYIHDREFSISELQAFAPEKNPGELVKQWIEVRPGGNHVLSFLDIAVTNSISSDVLVRSLGALKHVLRRVGDQTQGLWGPLWIRYGYQSNLPMSWETELAVLAGSIAFRVSGPQP